MSLCRGQNTFEPDDDQIADQMRTNVLWTSAHVFLLEPAHPSRNFALDLALGLHR
jgi:hypothetical protein